MAHRGLQVGGCFLLKVCYPSFSAFGPDTCFSIFSLAYLKEVYMQDHQVFSTAQPFSSVFSTHVRINETTI